MGQVFRGSEGIVELWLNEHGMLESRYIKSVAHQASAYLWIVNVVAPGPGFEPGLKDSKSFVLPLDDPGFWERFAVPKSITDATLTQSGGLSSIGRAPVLHTGGSGFESRRLHHPNRGGSSVVERLPSKQNVAGSNPVPRSITHV